jgi:prophage tail gpP-like protein
MSGALDAATSVRSARGDKDPGGLRKLLGKTGRFPPVFLVITPLAEPKREVTLNLFLSYTFSSSVLIPVDTFSFQFTAPNDDTPPVDIIKSGDIVRLEANNITLATGIIDTVDIETTRDGGEMVSLEGRDLMSQYEDNDAISIDDSPIWKNKYKISQVLTELNKSTRVNKFELQDAPEEGYLFATEPGETKLSALQRYLEPLNCIAWMTPDGKIKAGRPNMSQTPKGRLILSKSKRDSNVLSMKATRQTTKVPNIIVPVWVGQEETQARTPKQNRLLNNSKDPSRLRQFGHRVIKTVMVSTPEGDQAQDLAEINRLQAGGQNLLQAHAKREMAKARMDELVVQATIAGHYNDLGEPFMPDTVYKIEYDRAGS